MITSGVKELESTKNMKKQHIVSCQSLGTSPSPGGGVLVGGPTNNYQDKGWSSERVPHPSGSTCSSISRRRRHISALATPFYSGRQLPSKWEDAERWICSPVLGYGTVANSNYSHSSYQRRPKSKSGPILPPGVAPSFESGGGSVRNFLVNGSSSPFATGVFMPHGVTRGNSIGCGVGGGGGVNVGRSASLPGWSDLICESSSPSSGDEKLDDISNAENTVSPVVSRRDMATQMSPKSSSNSSPRRRSSSPPSILPIVESKSDHNAKLEIREVQVDNRATIISWSRRHGSCLTMKALHDIDDFSRNARDSCSWDISEAASEISKLQREEAKITAWENLQKAKAEAAIRKLEMKLEKKRSSSMDKILNRLRSAQNKAQEMRNSITVKEDLQTPKRLPSITCSRKHSRLCSLHSCFTRHAF